MTDSKKQNLKIDIPFEDIAKPKIIIFGVGGAGGNALNNMIRSNLEGVEFIAANTDAQALNNSLAENKIQLGLKTTKGLGAGSFPDKGKTAAEENVAEIEKYLEGSNMVFIAAGMGGGTGTGAAPVIAKLAREKDILTVGVVTKPFHFEGKHRMDMAVKGIDELKKCLDTLIVIPNQNLFRIANEQTTFESAFKMADDVLHAGVRGITDLITMPGLVNLDFADIRTIMTKMGKAMMGTGEAEGQDRAILACEEAISNPLLDDVSIKGAKGVLVNMTGGPDMTLFEADMAVNAIKKEVDPSANIIFGSAFNENMQGRIRISVVATGIDVEEFKQDALRAQENHEPSRFKADLGEGLDQGLNKGSFFDPGVCLKPEDELVEEISDVNFKPSKSFSKEENLDYGRQNEDLELFSSIQEEPEQEAFFNEKEDALEDSYNESVSTEIFEAPKLEKKKPYRQAPRKKEGSGFSLFGFMNSVKSKNEDVEQDIVEEINGAKFKEPSLKKPVKASNAGVDKKRKEFFKATIFDDEIVPQKRNEDLDDILNVPAFFRRKK